MNFLLFKIHRECPPEFLLIKTLPSKSSSHLLTLLQLQLFFFFGEGTACVSDSDSLSLPPANTGKHGTVKKSSMWLKDSHCEWLELETAPDGENVVGLFCSLCKKHSKLPRNGSATYPPILFFKFLTGQQAMMNNT